jgi:hypothetical protein
MEDRAGGARARSAVIKDRCMIMEHHAGDAWPPLRGRGTPQSPAQQQRSTASLATQAGRSRRRVTRRFPRAGRAAGRWRYRDYSIGGP